MLEFTTPSDYHKIYIRVMDPAQGIYNDVQEQDEDTTHLKM